MGGAKTTRNAIMHQRKISHDKIPIKNSDGIFFDVIMDTLLRSNEFTLIITLKPDLIIS